MQIGCDPEFFIRDKDGRPRPAHLFFPPKEKKDSGDHTGANKIAGFFRDGYALEVNAMPSPCIALLQESARGVLKRARKLLPEGFTLDAISRVDVDPSEASGKDAPRDVKTFGCHPSMNAYSETAELPRITANRHKFRYAGGHLHFGTTGTVHEAPETHPALVKYIDLKMGLPLAVYQLNMPEVFARRKYYGQAGEFRSQVYPGVQVRPPRYPGEHPMYHTTSAGTGVEYRVPGAELFRHNALVFLFGNMARKAIRAFTKTQKEAWDKSIEGELQIAINTGAGAERLLKKLNPDLYEVMVKLRDVKDLSTFTYPDIPVEFHTGFYELYQKWGLQISANAQEQLFGFVR